MQVATIWGVRAVALIVSGFRCFEDLEESVSDTGGIDFGAVYRAALAEQDPEKKLALLRNVEQALLSWRIADERTLDPPPKRASRAESSPSAKPLPNVS